MKDQNKYDADYRKKRYLESLTRHGESPESLQWADYRAAAIRYRQLTKDLHFRDKTILDAGCGMGDLLPYIYAQTDVFDYLGMDIVPDFTEIASKRYKGHRFRTGDPFSGDLPDSSFDIVLSSGTMNGYASDWPEQRKRIIENMFMIAREAVAFNMAGSFDPKKPHTSKVAYAFIPEILEFCQQLCSRVVLRAHYHSKDFTILMFKDHKP